MQELMTYKLITKRISQLQYINFPLRHSDIHSQQLNYYYHLEIQIYIRVNISIYLRQKNNINKLKLLKNKRQLSLSRRDNINNMQELMTYKLITKRISQLQYINFPLRHSDIHSSTSINWSKQLNFESVKESQQCWCVSYLNEIQTSN